MFYLLKKKCILRFIGYNITFIQRTYYINYNDQRKAGVVKNIKKYVKMSRALKIN